MSVEENQQISEKVEKSSSINEYASCNIRFDIDVAKRFAANIRDMYSLQMELKTNPQQQHHFIFDAMVLQQLNSELEKINAAFPRCYVYKRDPSSMKGTNN